MKKLFFCAIATILLASCTPKWEYKIVSFDNETSSDFRAPNIQVSLEELNEYGAEGWELVDVYTTTETVHPNFGDEKYVTGIRENTRTRKVTYVFKRKI